MASNPGGVGLQCSCLLSRSDRPWALMTKRKTLYSHIWFNGFLCLFERSASLTEVLIAIKGALVSFNQWSLCVKSSGNCFWEVFLLQGNVCPQDEICNLLCRIENKLQQKSTGHCLAHLSKTACNINWSVFDKDITPFFPMALAMAIFFNKSNIFRPLLFLNKHLVPALVPVLMNMQSTFW